MIANFIVEYNALDRDQIVTFKTYMTKKRHLDNMTIDTDDVKLNILGGKVKLIPQSTDPYTNLN